MDKELEKELRKNYKKGLKAIPLFVWFLLSCILMVFLLIYAINFRVRAQATGGMLGEGTGTLAGRAVGSLEGLTIGQKEGFEAGKEEGLSAKDTTAELATKIKEVEKLEVLIASGTFSDVLSIGKTNNLDYAALLSMKYNAVFTVDLETASFDLEGDGLHIVLDQPVVEFNPVGEIEKRNEYQKEGFIFKPGSALDGYDAVNNSANQMRAKATDKLQNDESLMKAARTSARMQLTQLVNAASITKPEVIVEFRGGNSR